MAQVKICGKMTDCSGFAFGIPLDCLVLGMAAANAFSRSPSLLKNTSTVKGEEQSAA